MVFPNVPVYSETFFNYLIKGLIDKDYKIIVFTRNKDKVFTTYPVYEPYTVTGNLFLDSINVVGVAIWLYLIRPVVTRKYLRLLKDDEIKGVEALKLLYQNAHILRRTLDWLYFGFATMTIGKEQVAKAIGAKMAMSIRGYDISITPLGKNNYYNLTWKYLDKLHYLSEDLLIIAHKLGLAENLQATKITPAVDTIQFRNIERKYFVYGQVRILTVARLHWKKGLNYALQAMRELLEKGMDFSYSIVGTGSEYEKLCFMIHDLDLTGNVKLLGKKTHGEVKELLLESDIFLMPSVQEGFCNAVIEAQASGCLCVVTNAEGLAENVINEETGTVVAKREPKAIAEAIQNLASRSPDLLSVISRNAQTRVKEEFDIKDHIKRWEDFFHI